MARNYVTGVWQNIVFEEYLPLLLGANMPKYEQYDDSLNPQIDNEFAAAAFRYGHALVAATL